MTYLVTFSDRGLDEFESLPTSVQSRMLPKIRALATNPRPPGVVAISGKHKTYRIRIGDYRVVYTIDDGILLVLVIGAGHRKNFYDRF